MFNRYKIRGVQQDDTDPAWIVAEVDFYNSGQETKQYHCFVRIQHLGQPPAAILDRLQAQCDRMGVHADLQSVKAIIGQEQTVQAFSPGHYVYNEAVSFPGFATEVTVPVGVKERLVYAAFRVVGGVTTAAAVRAEVETAPGSGVFSNVAQWRSGAGAAAASDSPGAFPVRGGHKYKFTEPETGGTRTNILYSFRDELKGGV